jgi:sugar lactone lactonase YvrE
MKAMKTMTSNLFLALLFFVCSALPTFAQYGSPQGMATDLGGNLWLAEASSNAVIEISPANGATLKKITAGLSNPVRVAFDSSNNMYVANLVGNNVTIYSSAGALSKTISGINRPLGVAVDGAGNLFVASNSGDEVYVYNAAGTFLRTLDTDTSGHFFDAPGAAAVRGSNLYLAFNDGSVISYNSSNFASGTAIEVTKYEHSGSGGPTGIAFDSLGDVYVSYYYTNDVVEYSPSGSVLTDITSTISQPEGIVVDNTPLLFVANTASSNTISVFNNLNLLRQLNGQGRVINFDTDTNGKAIASGSSVNNTYAPWGVTFESWSDTSAGTAYAVTCSNPTAASQPNAISFSSYSCFLNQEALKSQGSNPGVIQASFTQPATTVSIQVYQACIGAGQDNACLPPQGQAYLTAYNSSGGVIGTTKWATQDGAWQPLTITAAPGTIAFVQFSCTWYGSSGGSAPGLGWSMAAMFDNMTFE